MNKNIFKKAFTLAEIMIVLTIVGILVAVLLPSAFHSTPDQDLMKFKKSNTTFYNIVNEMVSSGRYFKPGDLSYLPKDNKKPEDDNATKVNYMCKVFSDILNAKKDECGTDNNSSQPSIFYVPYSLTCSGANCNGPEAGNCCNISNAKKKIDAICAAIASPKGVTTADNVIWFEPKVTRSDDFIDAECKNSVAALKDKIDCNYKYKVFCLKIGSKYYGYGIRSDGKVLPGYNADNDVEADITKNN